MACIIQSTLHTERNKTFISTVGSLCHTIIKFQEEIQSPCPVAVEKSL